MGWHHCVNPAASGVILSVPITRSNRQTEIIQATLDLAFEVGPDAVSTSLIAKKLGVSQPAIYKHFKTKDAIWLVISEHLCERIHANVQICKASSSTPECRLRDLVLGHLSFVRDVPAMPDIMVMRRASRSHQIIRQKLQTEMAQLRGLMVDLIRQSQDRGTMRADITATDIAILVMGVIQSLVLRMIVSRDPSRLLVDGERLIDLQIGILTPEKTAQ